VQIGFGIPGPGLVFFPQTLQSTDAPAAPVLHIVGSGAPVATFSYTASGTAYQQFNASGAAVKTLSATASGAAVQRFNASGSPVASLSKTASGAATQRFTASGAAFATLSAFASGAATNTPPDGSSTGSGSPVATLSAFASGTATNTPKMGAPPIILITGQAAKKRRKKLPPFEIDDKPDPVFAELPEITPTRRIKVPDVTDKQHSVNVTDKQHVKRRRWQREEDELIQMIMAGAA
jgi:hypothetical protein